MNPTKRKKEPPDPLILLSGSCSGGRFPPILGLSVLCSTSSFSQDLFPRLDLSHCSVHPILYGLPFLSLPDLCLLELQGGRSSAYVGSGDWPSFLLVPVCSTRQIGPNVFCVALGDSQQSFRACRKDQLSANPFIRKGKLALASTFLQAVRRGSSRFNRESSISQVGPILQFREPRLPTLGRKGQAWQIRSVSLRYSSLCLLFRRQFQVCAPFPYSLLLL